MNLKALILLIAGHLVTDINTGALPAFLPFIKEFLNLSYTMTASIMLIFNVTSSIIQPIFGYFSDRWSARWLLPSGCFIASLGMALLGFGSSYSWILFFAALSGLGQGSYHPEGFKTVNFLSGEKKATGISLFLVGGSLGVSLGPFMATLFFKYLGLKGSLLFLPAGIAMALIFLATPSWKVKTELLIHRAKGLRTSGFSRQGLFPMALLLLVVVLRSATQLSIQTFVPFYFRPGEYPATWGEGFSPLWSLIPRCLRRGSSFRIRGFLISPPSPLRWGKVGMGVDVARIPPHLNPPPPRGEEVIFLTQLGSERLMKWWLSPLKNF